MVAFTAKYCGNRVADVEATSSGKTRPGESSAPKVVGSRNICGIPQPITLENRSVIIHHRK